MSSSGKMISMSEVAKHNKASDCWVVIHGKVYDVTSFLPEHPGGSKLILNFAGKDATPGFEPVHPKDIVKILPSNAYIGELDKSTISKDQSSNQEEVAKVQQVQFLEGRPHISYLVNIFDFEAVAKQVMKKEAWDYYSSGSEDEITLRENHSAFQRIWLKPRILVNVGKIDMRCKLLGNASSFPLYITATALAKLAHPEGEVVLTRAAYNQGIIQMCPTLASCSLDEMIAARKEGQTQWFQLYVNRNRSITKELVEKAERGGMKGLFITVDAPQLGRREKDMRNKFLANPPDVQKSDKINRNQGTARAISQFIDPTLKWEDIKWFQSITSMPIVLKGVQCAEDAVLAVKHGVQGIVLSNHGGRQLDFARSAIEILPEVMEALRKIGAENKIEVFVDGGIRRGSDIFKAIALGAKGVGIGRPVLYGLAGYGQDGVERVIEILKEEFENCMMLMGTPSLADIHPNMLNARNLNDHFAVQPKDFLSSITYIPLDHVKAKL